MRDQGELKAGQLLLVNGASGCVGLFAVQPDVELGASVTAVCSAATFDLVTRAGASDCIDDRTSDFATLGMKWDLIFDAAATRHFSNLPRGARAPRHLRHDHRQRRRPGGATAQPAAIPGEPVIVMKPTVSDLDFVRTLVENGKLKANVGRVFPIAQLAEAQALAESGKASGKVVVTVG